MMNRADVSTVATAGEARDIAIEWSHWSGEQSLSYGDLFDWQDYFSSIVAKFPELEDEFTENGIPS